MLPKQYRLPKKEIEEVLKCGKHFYSDNFFIKYKKNTALSKNQNPRACIIVSTKVSTKATKRNLIKRRLRNALYLIFKEIPFKLDIVLIAKNSLLEKKYKDIVMELKKAFNQLLKKI